MQTKNLEYFERIINEIREKMDRKCPKCSKLCNFRKNNKTVLRCYKKTCRFEFNIFRKTVFYKRDSIICLKVLDFWSQSFTVKTIATFLKIDVKTVKRILKKFFKKIVNNYYKNFNQIGGNDMIIEIDESKFGKRKYNKGHFVDGIWILGMVERSIERKIFLIPILNQKKNTMQPIIKNYVNSNSIIYTDGHGGYKGLDKHFISHKTVNHSKEYKVPNTNIHTNTIKSNWGVLKREITPKYRNLKYIMPYLVRFMIKRNEDGDLLVNLIKYYLY